MTPSPWWRADIHADRRPRLLLRNRIVAAIRAWLVARDFVEIDPAALQISPGNETHLHAFSTEEIGIGSGRQALHLHTSPEFALKKLLAAGERQPFSLAHVYRNRERGPLHHPEFTMLEWYRAGEPYDAVMEDAVAFLRLAAELGRRPVATFRGRRCDMTAEPERLAVADAFRDLACIDLPATLSETGAPVAAAMRAACAAAGIRCAEDDTWSDMFSRVLVERIEPRLGEGRPTLLDRYPIPEAALARPTPDDPRLAERFELYVCGVELANGFGELTDPAEQRRRFEADMDEKARLYGESYPLDEDFIAALAAMPDASGVALGLDRLVMLAAGAERIADVIWTPVA
ncbi:EF-P lysine aminoacylase EpmA [Enterovirga sp.]|uniref:EF-P lysine aminoacylase EpmA n=1 Tax=Enterovirga sp. TaxID=2026350 RepID=UPI002CEC1E4D|nr:EF-P lysine aminoacylase EpmA [Enterovirga sp.]HMO28461.1 EF-P lysine aminoacylase EpmA [Enterovirga sp.]